MLFDIKHIHSADAHRVSLGLTEVDRLCESVADIDIDTFAEKLWVCERVPR